MLWGRMRARLQGELLGAMPPPGAPPGALSPIQPRKHHGIPLYSVAITTEVLSINTRRATFDDTRHANDEGGQLLSYHSPCLPSSLSLSVSSTSLQAGLSVRQDRSLRNTETVPPSPLPSCPLVTTLPGNGIVCTQQRCISLSRRLVSPHALWISSVTSLIVQ
jgi:hypothetical protein